MRAGTCFGQGGKGCGARQGFVQVKAAGIVMVQNHPAPSVLKNSLIEAGLVPVGEITSLFSGLYCEGQGSLRRCSPPHPRAALAEMPSAILLLFLSIPGTSHLQLVIGLAGKRGRGKRMGKKSFISISKGVFHSRGAGPELTMSLTAPCQRETWASISSPVPPGQS